MYETRLGEALEESRACADEAYTVCLNDVPVGMYGVSAKGAPWLIGTYDLRKVAVPFLRYGSSIVEGWREKYGFLQNYVSADNVESIRWLQGLGFIVNDEVPLPTPSGMDFYSFHM